MGPFAENDEAPDRDCCDGRAQAASIELIEALLRTQPAGPLRRSSAAAERTGAPQPFTITSVRRRESLFADGIADHVDLLGRYAGLEDLVRLGLRHTNDGVHPAQDPAIETFH